MSADTANQGGTPGAATPAEPAASADQVVVNPVELASVEKPQPQEADSAVQDVNLGMLLDIPVDIHVEIGRTRASIRDILQLGPGAIVELDRLAGQPADIMVNGKLIGQGDIVVINDTFGIRITKLVGVEERLDPVIGK